MSMKIDQLQPQVRRLVKELAAKDEALLELRRILTAQIEALTEERDILAADFAAVGRTLIMRDRELIAKDKALREILRHIHEEPMSEDYITGVVGTARL